MKKFSRFSERMCQSCSLVTAVVMLLVFYSTTYEHFSKPALFNSSCSCQSLFTIGACGLSSYYQDETLPNNYRNIFRILERVRHGAPMFNIKLLNDLARFLPKLLRDFEFSNKTFSSQTPNITLETKYHQKLKQTTSSLTYIPCKVHSYTKEEIKECLKRRKAITGRILRIAFVGDSQVRNLLEQMIKFLRVKRNLRAGNDMGLNLSTSFLDTKYKQDLPVEGDDIQLRLYWSAFLGKPRDNTVTYQGAEDLFRVWAVNKTTQHGEEVPDILYFDDGMWSTGRHTEWGAVSVVKNDFDRLKPYLQNISRTTRLILRTQTPVKEWVAKHAVPNSGLDMMNQIAWWVFRDTDLWIWDTVTPVYLREREDCKAYWKTGFGRSLPREWACFDYQHPSKISEMVAGNMIWNYVCNGINKIDDSHCCM
ncbi:hypothetical protein FHG87_003254 [Trinorchestia longiramus]|nr:hypothetical protein FHG87_003254 [Trinorchestia longiramus]